MIEDTKKPLISVVIAVFNGERFIQECIDAVLAQTYSHIEVILVDDGSTDDTLKIVKNNFCDQVKIIKQRNQKVAAARDNGMQHISGKYVAFCDHDDIWEPEKLKFQVAEMEQNNAICLVHTDAIEDRLRTGIKTRYSLLHPGIKDTGNIFHWMVKKYAIPLFSTVMMRVEFLEKFNIRFINSPPGADDIGVLLEMLIYGGSFGYIDEPLVTRRMHSSNQSSDYLWRFQQRVALYSYILEKHQKKAKDSGSNKRDLKAVKWGLSDAACRTADHTFETGESTYLRSLYVKAWILCPLKMKALIKYVLLSVFGLSTLRFIKKRLMYIKIAILFMSVNALWI
ncbi:glycosyltransferase [Candidatus Omnitrophota bacterium]